MNSSVKSLVPIVTAGLPLPGWSELDEELPPPPLLELLSSPPQPTAAASTPAASRRISRGMRRVDMGLSSVVELGGRGWRVGGRLAGLELLGQRQAARCPRALHEAEQPVHGHGEHDGEDGR